jgi:hypothetical protein
VARRVLNGSLVRSEHNWGMTDGPGVPTGDGDSPTPVEWDVLDVPNCAECLHSMEAASTPRGGVVWQCPNCGAVRIA